QLVYQPRLAGHVRVAVDAQQVREPPFLGRIAHYLVRTCSEIAPQVDVVAIRLRPVYDDVQVILGQRVRRRERLASGDTQVATVPVPEKTKRRNGSCDGLRVRYDDVDVDDRLRGETLDRRAADMFDRNRELLDRRPHVRSNLFERVDPRGVVLDHVGSRA